MSITKYLLINLPERTDRLAHADSQLKSVNIPYEIVHGVKLPLDGTGRFTHAGEVGCFHSHLTCFDIARQNKSGHTIVMEDDIVFSNNFQTHFPKYLELIEKTDWDLFQFYNAKNSEHSLRIITDIPTKNMHFYVINKNSAEFLYELVKRANRIIDEVFTTMAKENVIKMYSAGEQLVKQNTALSSDIHKGRLSWLRRNCNGVFV